MPAAERDAHGDHFTLGHHRLDLGPRVFELLVQPREGLLHARPTASDPGYVRVQGVVLRIELFR